MIECIFTIDYEIYGNGEGSLHELVYDPAERLIRLFVDQGVRFVAYVEAAELEVIEAAGTDAASSDVRRQVNEMYQKGFEIALHMHPQWFNARFNRGNWLLDYAEYNLCVLPRERIVQLVARAIAHLRDLVGNVNFSPFSFRAGNWLFLPSRVVSSVLAEHGVRLDSSVFKGGMQHAHGLDYRPALKNGYYWTFDDDVNAHSPGGRLLEIPIYTRMVPFWRMLTGKRVALQKKGRSVGPRAASRTLSDRLHLLHDRLRPWYPLKFDFCRMTLKEMTSMMDIVIAQDRRSPDAYKPIVAIGHTKDLIDFESIAQFLSYLKAKGIPVSTLQAVHPKCL